MALCKQFEVVKAEFETCDMMPDIIQISDANEPAATDEIGNCNGSC